MKSRKENIFIYISIFFELALFVVLSLKINQLNFCSGPNDCNIVLKSPLYNVYSIGFSFIYFTLLLFLMFFFILHLFVKRKTFDFVLLFLVVMQYICFICFDLQYNLLLWGRVLAYVILSLVTVINSISLFYNIRRKENSWPSLYVVECTDKFGLTCR